MRSVNKYIVIIFQLNKNQSNMNEIKNLVEQLIELTGIHGASVVPIRYALFFIIAIFLSWFFWLGRMVHPSSNHTKIASKTPTQWDTLFI